MPSKLWEPIVLDAQDKTRAMEQIDQELEYWPSFIVDFCKKRYQRIKQIHRRQRKLILTSNNQTELSVYKKKEARRESSREKKAEARAQLDTMVEKELLERLQSGVYGEIYNFPKEEFDETLDQLGQESLSEDFDSEEFEEDFDSEEDFDDEDVKEEPSRKRIEIEYEQEARDPRNMITREVKSRQRQ